MPKKGLAIFLTVVMLGAVPVKAEAFDLASAAVGAMVMQVLMPLFQGGGGSNDDKEKKKQDKEEQKKEKELKKLTPAMTVEALKTMAEAGEVQAQCLLSYAYLTGQLGLSTDTDMAEYWQDKAYKQNPELVTNFIPVEFGKDKVAMSRLFAISGARSHTGEYGVKQSYEDAVAWNMLGKNFNDKMAIAYLGSAYYTGRGVAQDYKAAVALFYQSSKEPVSLALLSDAYGSGKGVQKNPEKSKMYAEYLKRIVNARQQKKYERALKKYNKRIEAGDLNGIVRQ